MADPGEGPLDDPPLWHDDEADGLVGAFDDLDFPAPGRRHDSRHFRPLISRVGEDALDERKAPPRAGQQSARTVAVLNVGGQDAHAEQEAERVDEVEHLRGAFAARDLLACIIALAVERRPPF